MVSKKMEIYVSRSCDLKICDFTYSNPGKGRKSLTVSEIKANLNKCSKFKLL